MGRFSTVLGATSAAVVLTISATAAAQGIVPDRSTIVRISSPVSVPGVVLPAGEYLFRLADSNTNRNIVQIFDKDRSKIYATLIAIPAERTEISDDAVITFRETPANQAPALRYWYYAGEKTGQEFAYPRQQAVEIARASGESVMAMDTAGEDFEAMQKAELQRVDANSPAVMAQNDAAATPAASAPAAADAHAGHANMSAQSSTSAPAQPASGTQPGAESQMATTNSQPVAQSETSTQPAPSAAADVTASPAAPAPAPAAASTADRDAAPRADAAAPAAAQTAASGQSGTDADRQATPVGTSGTSSAAQGGELPRTASELPLIALLGFLALGAAAALRMVRRGMIV